MGQFRQLLSKASLNNILFKEAFQDTQGNHTEIFKKTVKNVKRTRRINAMNRIQIELRFAAGQ